MADHGFLLLVIQGFYPLEKKGMTIDVTKDLKWPARFQIQRITLR
jgi:hypothetical protein